VRRRDEYRQRDIQIEREKRKRTETDVVIRIERTCVAGVQVMAAARRRRRLRLHDGGDRGDNTTAHDEWCCTTTDVSDGAPATGELPVVTRRQLCSGGSGDARQMWPPSAHQKERDR